jgi:hypothetical protein
MEGVGEILGEAIAELGAGALEAFPERGFGDIEVAGGVGAGLAVEVEAVDGGFEGVGQFVEAGFEDFEDRGLAGDAIFLPSGHGAIEVFDFGGGKGLAFFVPEPVAVFIADEAAHPGAEIAGEVKGFDFTVGGYEGILDDILRGLVVTGEGAGVDEEFAVVLANEDGEGFAVSEEGWGGGGLVGHDGKGCYKILAARGRIVTFFWQSCEVAEARRKRKFDND